MKHVHFNIQKHKPLKEEFLHPHEITIPITIAPNIYPPEIHHPAPAHGHEEGFSKGYAQGYSQASLGSVLLGSSGTHATEDTGILYDSPQYADIQQAYPQQQLDYGNSVYALPNVQYADEIPYDMQTQYGDELLYNPSSPTGRDIGGGGKFPQQFMQAANEVLYNPTGPTGGGGKYPQLPQQFMQATKEVLYDPNDISGRAGGGGEKYPQQPQQFMKASVTEVEYKPLSQAGTQKKSQPIAYREIKYPW